MSTSLQRMANVDGTITPAEEARISVLDRGFLYGDSVYEVFRTYSGVPLFYAEHLDRLENSARLSHMHISQSREELTAEIRRTVQATGAKAGDDVYVRYHVTRGTGPVDLFPDPKLKTSYVVLVKEVPKWNEEFYTRGMRLAIPATRRNPTNSLDPNIKGGNYLNNILALAEATDLGADDCVILNRDNLVTECANSNVFFVIEGKLLTPSQAAGNLQGITKAALHTACGNAGLEVHEEDIHVDDLPRADECFVTSATREVMPACSLRLEEGATLEFPTGGGDVTRRVSELYRAHVERYVAEHQDLAMI